MALGQRRINRLQNRARRTANRVGRRARRRGMSAEPVIPGAKVLTANQGGAVKSETEDQRSKRMEKEDIKVRGYFHGGKVKGYGGGGKVKGKK